ncbi:hypothetical protein, partial [Methanothermobacter sp.]|uniref:hypothetical protein n=1 Tax=Methanothermobacter sp. TaxID=1884223 RepID=UPI003C75104E
EHTIQYYAIDEAGNKATGTARYNIRNEPVNCTLKLYSSGLKGGDGSSTGANYMTSMISMGCRLKNTLW